LYKTGERIVPGAVSEATLSRHYARYFFAAEFCKEARVLNVASGSGYGSEVLLATAREVYNVDISEQLVAYGNKRYGGYRNHFLHMDAECLSFPSGFFDAIVSLETIEHLRDAQKFLKECHRALRPRGTFIVSSPNRVITSPLSPIPANRYHVKEWDFEEFQQFTTPFFDLQGSYGQACVPQSAPSRSWSVPLRQAVTPVLPGVVVKFIKRRIKHYQELPWNEVQLLNVDVVQQAERKAFYPNGDGRAYEVILFVMTRRA
jgi:SAM-dependent methyltransferase